MLTKAKIGLIVTLIGIIFYIVAIVFFFLIFNPFIGIFLFPFMIILAGLGVLYAGLEQRGRGFMLNLYGFGISAFTAFTIFFIFNRITGVWMEAMIALIVVFTLFWIIIFTPAGLYKIIKQEEFPGGYIFIVIWAGCVMFFLIIYTITTVALGQENFSELYSRTFLIGLNISVLLGTITSGLLILAYFIHGND